VKSLNNSQNTTCASYDYYSSNSACHVLKHLLESRNMLCLKKL